jgi:deferrochelatase/peroxidase EfeB
MPVDLTVPLDWLRASGDSSAMLDDLQANILRSHARDHLTVLFLWFVGAEAGRQFLRELAVRMKTAREHLLEVAEYKASGKPGRAFIGAGLTASGYAKLGVAAQRHPPDPSFRAGMKAAGRALKDPPPQRWEKQYRQAIDAVVLVGDHDPTRHARALATVRDLLSPAVTVLGEETGLAQHNANGDGIEHFGYVDGRSQPLFLVQDIATERLRGDGAAVWDPAFPIGRVITPDPAAPNPVRHFGTYLVFRKLEQNVRLFKTNVQRLADDLKLDGGDRHRAGAMIVGRFEDGTPVTRQRAPGMCHPVPNDFDYASDGDGMKCPFFSHIRKTNPRGSSGFGDAADERLHIMARRGQTYGVRTDNPNDGLVDNKPTGGVGLLFMALNVDIGNQFEYTQSVWADNPEFPRVPNGIVSTIDLVIGQGDRTKFTSARRWGGDPDTDTRTTVGFRQAVTFKGGEYFFLPSLAFLRSL